MEMHTNFLTIVVVLAPFSLPMVVFVVAALCLRRAHNLVFRWSWHLAFVDGLYGDTVHGIVGSFGTVSF